MSAPIVLALRLITAIALYCFLGWALFFLWREVRRQSQSLASRRVPGISITVKHADDPSILKHFAQAEITLGRDPGCDIPLMDDTVSTRHAQLTYHHTQWWLADLSSMNGTILNQAAVSMPTVITSGDEIKCGSTRLIIALSPNLIIEPTQRLEKQE
ncbi:MAG: FHA domain-containing protein [Chloroflexi bacterium]|jgi:pSer/pThr/pTyr-binding forkhead associated (FHA) protein|nr:FHA domain-containing protein [Chloroflexota bacterium]